jgi:serine phosphatase RsbU (regulator of sigma subunit)
LILVARDDVREIYGDGPFLGLRPDIETPIKEETLHAGDALFAYTDGLCDQLDSRRREFPLGQAAARALQDAPPMAGVLARIIAAFDDFRGPVGAFDDITVIGLRIGLPPAAGATPAAGAP